MDFFNYVVNNYLIIDKSTYLTIVIGQITIYGILLTFYQFIVSFQGTGDNSGQKYLGINLIEYYVNMEVRFFKRIISTQLFKWLFILEILYKPIISVYGKKISNNVITICNFFWYAYVVFSFAVFGILFLKCAKCVWSLKFATDIQENENITNHINSDFMRRTFRQRLRKTKIEMLIDDMESLGWYIKQEDDSRFYGRYKRLIMDISDVYQKTKEEEITCLLTKNKEVKNQVAWIANMENECYLLSNFIKEKYIQLDPSMEKYIQNLHLKLLKLNLMRASFEGKKNIYIDILKKDKNSVDCREWGELTEAIFEKCTLENKKNMIENLYCEYLNKSSWIQLYCEKILEWLLKKEIRDVFADKRQQKELVYVFEGVLYDDKFNEVYARELSECLISYNEKKVEELIKLVNKKNCTYILVYMIIYYSVYKFRGGWKYINIGMLREIVKNGTRLEREPEEINGFISNTWINHRYSEDMYMTLVENIDKEITEDWLERIYQQKSIDAFYITIIKLCVYDQEYYWFDQKGKIEPKILFINELAKHEEVLTVKNVQEMVAQMQYNDFRKLENWPENLHITLRSLLLTNMQISDALLDDKKNYLYYISIGQYLLVKYVGEFDVSEVKKEIIRKAYVASNISIQEYVEYLDRECYICGIELCYVKKEKMKSFLMEVV